MLQTFCYPTLNSKEMQTYYQTRLQTTKPDMSKKQRDWDQDKGLVFQVQDKDIKMFLAWTWQSWHHVTVCEQPWINCKEDTFLMRILKQEIITINYNSKVRVIDNHTSRWQIQYSLNIHQGPMPLDHHGNKSNINQWINTKVYTSQREWHSLWNVNIVSESTFLPSTGEHMMGILTGSKDPVEIPWEWEQHNSGAK